MRIVRATIYPNHEVISIGIDFQILPHLSGTYQEIHCNVLAIADDYTVFEIASTFRGPFVQVDRDDWKP